MYVLEFAGEHDRFAAREAATAATDVRRIATGLGIARGIDGVERLAFTHRAAELVGRTAASVDDARILLEAASIERSGSVAVAARDVRGSTGIDTQRAERVLGQVLVDRGFAVDLDDPDHELRALFAAPPSVAAGEDDTGDGGEGGIGEEHAPVGSLPDSPVEAPKSPEEAVCVLGWTAAEARRDFAPAPTDRPFFQPGSMDPMLARGLANLAGARPGRTILDPMCGTGGVLVEASLVGARVLGMDAQAKMVRGTRQNLRAYLDDDFAVLRGDATRPPIRGGVDGVVFDAPYGRQSAIAATDRESLVREALAAAADLAPRAVVVGDRSWAGQAREVGWTVESTFQRRVHRSLVRNVLVLDRVESVP